MIDLQTAETPLRYAIVSPADLEATALKLAGYNLGDSCQASG
jgi:hypothetical protein